MKKLITWLTKGTKIVKILKQIYKALTIASSAVGTGETVAEQTGVVNQEAAEKISGIKEYIDLALEYLGDIMGWLGVSSEERALIARSGETRPTPTQIRDSIEETING